MYGGIHHRKSGSVATTMGNAEENLQITEEERTRQRLKNKSGHDFESAGAHSKVRYNRVGPMTKDASDAVVIRYVDGSKSYSRESGVSRHIHQRLIAELPCGASREQRTDEHRLDTLRHMGYRQINFVILYLFALFCASERGHPLLLIAAVSAHGVMKCNAKRHRQPQIGMRIAFRAQWGTKTSSTSHHITPSSTDCIHCATTCTC